MSLTLFALTITLASADTITTADGESAECEPESIVRYDVGEIDGATVRFEGCVVGCCLTGMPLVVAQLVWDRPEGVVPYTLVLGPGAYPGSYQVDTWGRSIQVAAAEAVGRPYHDAGPSCRELVPTPAGDGLLERPVACFGVAYTRHLDEAMWALALGEVEAARPILAETDPSGGWADNSEVHRAIWLSAARDRAVSQRRRGDAVGAALVARAALEMPDGVPPDPGASDDVEALNDLAWVMEQGGLAAPARELLERIVAAEPDRAVAWLNLGDAAWAMGDAEGARAAYSTYRGLQEASGRPVARWVPARESARRARPAKRPALPSPTLLVAAGDLEAARGALALGGGDEADAQSLLEAAASRAVRMPRPFTQRLYAGGPAPDPTLSCEAAQQLFGPHDCELAWSLEVFDGRIDDDLLMDRLVVGTRGGERAFALFTGARPQAPYAHLLVSGARELEWTVSTDWVSLGGDDGSFPRRVVVRWLDDDDLPAYATLEPLIEGR